MPILNVQVDNIGESGTEPTFIRIQTTDTAADVIADGYLNGIFSQGTPLNDSQMALVSTKTSPSASSTQTALYNVSFADGDWTLTKYGGGSGGGGWTTDASNTGSGLAFGTSSPNGWEWIADGNEVGIVSLVDEIWTVSFTAGFSVTATSGVLISGPGVGLEATGSGNNVILISDSGDVEITAGSSFSSVSTGSTTITGDTAVIISTTGSSADLTLTGNHSVVITSTTQDITIGAADTLTMTAGNSFSLVAGDGVGPNPSIITSANTLTITAEANDIVLVTPVGKVTMTTELGVEITGLPAFASPTAGAIAMIPANTDWEYLVLNTTSGEIRTIPYS